MNKIGILGGGNMGTAIISRVFKQYSLAVCEKDSGRARDLKKKFKAAVLDPKALIQKSDIIILAVKPQDMEGVLAEIKIFLDKKNIFFISIAAGLTTGFFEKRLGAGSRVIRAMPNMPAQIGEGVTALCKGRFASGKDLKTAEKIFAGIGETVIVDEDLMDSVTAVSGSGPAYVFLFVECFLKAAEGLGLEKTTAQKLVAATLRGSVDLLLRSKEEAADLRAKVTSKGGTTQAAMDVFLRHNIEKTFVQAVAAAKKRAGELRQ